MEVKTIRKRMQPEFDEIMKRTGGSLGSDIAFRKLLDNIHKGCFVEAESTNQGGRVTKIIRDRLGVPVAVEVNYTVYNTDTDEPIAVGKDCIAMADVTFWEPWEYDVSDDEYEDDSEWEEYYLSHGYVWDDERECYYNAETGDEVVW